MTGSKEIGIHLREKLYIIHRHIWVLIASVVIIFTLVAIGNFTAIPLYRAATRLRIEPKMPEVMPFKEPYSISGSQLDYYNTQYKILASKSLARKVLENFPPETRSQLTAGGLLNMVEIKPIAQSQLVDIRVVSPDPRLAAQIANIWADQFIRLSIEAKFESVQAVLAQLNRQLETQNRKVLDAQAELLAYKERERIVSLEDIQKELNEISEIYSSIKREREDKDLQLQHLEKYADQELSLETFPQVRYHSIVLQLRNRLVQLQANRGEYSQRYKESHPRMVQLNAEIATVEAGLREEIGKIIEGLRRERDLARANEENLLQDLEKQKTLFFTMEKKVNEIEGLKTRVDIDREVQQALLSRVSETRTSKGIEITNITVVDPAEVPQRPFKPRKLFNMLLALVIGSAGGVGAIFLLENLDTTVKTSAAAKNILKMPLLGVIPVYSQVGIWNGRMPPQIMKSNLGLIPEAYRNIRTGIYFSSASKPPRVILVTSSLPQEGKSDICAMLACSLSQGEERILLIDSDLRKPRLKKIFGLDRSKPGLADLLAGRNSVLEAVQTTEFARLGVITSGPIPPNPAELLNSERFREILTEFRRGWDRVILDSPPLLSVTDPTILGSIADGVIFVVRAGNTNAKVLSFCREKLEPVNANFLGFILNQADIHLGEDYYYYTRSYYA